VRPVRWLELCYGVTGPVLTLSGYKSVGVSVNNLGSANLEQAKEFVEFCAEVANYRNAS
jgi:hypothetical protein